MVASHLQFRNSVVFAEGYPTNRVKEIDPNSTAYPDRAGEILISPLLTYSPNATLDTIADEFNSTLLEGDHSKLVAYVNYARGDESMEELMGMSRGGWRSFGG